MFYNENYRLYKKKYNKLFVSHMLILESLTLLDISIALTASGTVASKISTRLECSSPSLSYHSTNLYT